MSASRRTPAAVAGVLGLFLIGLGLAPPAAAEPDPCFTAGTMDLNGDEHTDAVVGDPYATVAGQAEAGRIIVLYGDADDRIGEGARSVLTVANLGGTPQAGDHFGWAVATGNVDMDACADVVVGAPGADVPAADAGSVHVVYGSTDGLNAGTVSERITQSDAAGSTEAGDRFGETVAVGENLGQDTSVVVAGAPGEDIGSATDAGAVHVVNYSDTIPVQPRQVTQNTGGVPDTAEGGDQFGAAVALGVDLMRNDDSWELLVGAPGEGIGTRDSAGSVTVVSQIQGFPPVGTWQAERYTQNTPGVGDSVETGDRFGASLAAGTLSIIAPSSVRRIAVGVPGEDVGSRNTAGAVNLFTASGSGLEGLSYLTQDTAGVGGASETGDRFGASVAVMPGSTTQRLAVGAPHEDLGSATNAGTVQLFNFHNVASDSSLDQDSPGAAGVVHDQSRYGSAVVALEGAPERAWLVGNPFHATGAVHVVNVSGGFASRAWLPGSGGVPGAAARFGWSAGGHDDLG